MQVFRQKQYRMKKILLILFIGIALSSNAQKIEKLWTSEPVFKTPESVLYYTALDIVFVSNMGDVRDAKTGDGFIAQMNLEGEIVDMNWITGLNDPKGMAIQNGKLYVADINELIVIDIANASIIEKHLVADAKFLNDVTANQNETIFVSDMRDQRIYALMNNKFESWLQNDNLENVNGLWAENGKLYAGNAEVWEIDIKTKKMKELFGRTQGIDGLIKLSDGNFIFSNWPGRIHISNEGNITTLLNRAQKQHNTADIDYVPAKKIILVPTFFSNTVEAFILEK
jgi:hypothetical protein